MGGGCFFAFFFSRIKIPVIRHFAIFSCFSRILGSKRVDRFWIGSFRLSFSSVDRFWKFCLYPYVSICIHMHGYDEKKTVIKLCL